MDPTMGQASFAPTSNEQQLTEPASNVIGMSGYLTQADQAADHASSLAYPADTEAFAADVSTETVLAAVTGEEQPVVAEALPAVETPPEPPKYPVGKIDFNKPFEIFSTSDNQEFLQDVAILSVLPGAAYPVVITGFDAGENEHLVLQFDLEGDDIRGDWQLENLSTEPQTKFVRLFIDDERNLTADETIYDSEGAANRAYSHSDVFGVFPFVIPPRAPAVVEATVVGTDEELSDDEYSEEEEHDEGDADFQGSAPVVVEPASPAPSHPDAKWVNGRLIAPGQIVRFHKQYQGVRDVEVIKTREHSYATLFVKPQDGSNPYWALNKNLR